MAYTSGKIEKLSPTNFQWNIPRAEYLMRETLKSEAFSFPGTKHKFYFQIEKKYLPLFSLYFINPGKCKVKFHVQITFMYGSSQLRRDYYEIYLDKHHLLNFFDICPEIIFKFTSTQELTIPCKYFFFFNFSTQFHFCLLLF